MLKGFYLSCCKKTQILLIHFYFLSGSEMSVNDTPSSALELKTYAESEILWGIISLVLPWIQLHTQFLILSFLERHFTSFKVMCIISSLQWHFRSVMWHLMPLGTNTCRKQLDVPSWKSLAVKTMPYSDNNSWLKQTQNPKPKHPEITTWLQMLKKKISFWKLLSHFNI